VVFSVNILVVLEESVQWACGVGVVYLFIFVSMKCVCKKKLRGS
jgi:hypothetical protein